MNAWGETGEKKSFGLVGFIKFTFPRLWFGGCIRKMTVILNFIMVFSVKCC